MCEFVKVKQPHEPAGTLAEFQHGSCGRFGIVASSVSFVKHITCFCFVEPYA